jgi:hypothetical protein
VIGGKQLVEGWMEIKVEKVQLSITKARIFWDPIMFAFSQAAASFSYQTRTPICKSFQLAFSCILPSHKNSLAFSLLVDSHGHQLQQRWNPIPYLIKIKTVQNIQILKSYQRNEYQ